jgi:hypothetical protein
VAGQVGRDGHIHDGQTQGAGGRERPVKEDVRRGTAQSRDSERGPNKKVVRPSRRREMARRVVTERGISVRLACEIFTVSETCYRYEAKKNAENEKIADWLLRLTDNHRNWGFGLCYLYLRNVKGFKWNHKRVYRIYKGLELNLRIKPRKRLNREKPEPLAVPEEINQSGRWTSRTTSYLMAEASDYSMSLTTTTGKLWAWRSTSRCRLNGSSVP